MYFDNLTLAGIATVVAVVVFMLRLPRFDQDCPCWRTGLSGEAR